MGHATPYARVRLSIPRPRSPDILDPYPPSSQPLPPIPPEVLERLRRDPWSLNALDPALRERPEVLAAALDSGHPQAMEAISACVPPEVLRRPEIYAWLKAYRRALLPERVFFFQGTFGAVLDGEGLGTGLGGEVGGGGRHLAASLFYQRNGASAAAEHRLGLQTQGILYPAKRISMKERQSLIAFGAPLALAYGGAGRQAEFGLSLAYYLARGEVLATPVWGLQARVLAAPSDPRGSVAASLELQLPVWSALEGLERLGARLRGP